MLHTLRPVVAALALALVGCLSAQPARAIGLLRDADIEYGLTRLAAPLLRAAGLNPSRVKILVVNESGFNAFVIDNRTIFLNYGLILEVKTPEMLQAVIAHEAAHIANGHLARRAANMRNANMQSGLAMVLGVLAAAAGSGEAATGLIAGGQAAAMRGFLSHSRAEESAADRSALSFMTTAGVNPQGMVDVHSRFTGQDYLSLANRDPYMQSHPLFSERIRAAKDYVARYGAIGEASAEDIYWLERVQGKLSAFLRSPKWTLQRLENEPETDITLMRKAVAYHRQNQLAPARRYMQSALDARPDDPFYLDLMGQIMMENRQWQAALDAYGAAQAAAPTNPLILGGYGRGLLALDRPEDARDMLAQARARDARDIRILVDLARAYAATGEEGMAALTTAERMALSGNPREAARHARRALQVLPRGSAAWMRAQDMIPPEISNSRRTSP